MQLSTFNPTHNLAARMGGWSASHRKTAIFAWLAFVMASIVIGTAVGANTIDQNTNDSSGPSARADQILKQGGYKASGRLTEIVVVQNQHLKVSSPAFKATIADVAHSVAPMANVHNLRYPSGHAYRDQ